MLKHYYTDMVTDVEAPPRQVFNFFCNVDDWSDWSTAIDRCKLFGGEWKEGAWFMFAPKVGNLPSVPLVVRILEFVPGEKITWGVELPMATMKHRFSFLPREGGGTSIHHEEWSEGALTLAVYPAGGLIRKFNDVFARELASMF